MQRHPTASLLRAACPAMALACVLASASISAGEVYQWKDAKGVTHYSQTPPRTGAYKQRAIGNAGQAEATPTAVAAAAVENVQCTTARRNLALLEGDGVVQHDTDGDGKADTVLDATGRANQRELAQAAIKATCPAAAVAATP